MRGAAARAAVPPRTRAGTAPPGPRAPHTAGWKDAAGTHALATPEWRFLLSQLWGGKGRVCKVGESTLLPPPSASLLQAYAHHASSYYCYYCYYGYCP